MASEYKIAIQIAGKLDKSLKKSVDDANKQLNGLGSSVGGVAGSAISAFAKLGEMAAGSMMAVGGAMAAGAKESIDAGRTFEDSMANLAGIAGISKTSEEYAKLEAAAREMGETTSKTAAESADALSYMALAGWSVDDSVSALPEVLHLSEASGLDLARTSDLVTDSMSAAGVSIEDLSTYLDVMTKAQNSSNQSVEEAMEGMIKSSGQMRTLGGTYSDTATMLGILADNGLKGSEGGTALNSLLKRLTSTSGEAADAMAALGLSFFDSNGDFIGMEESLTQIDAALDGMTDKQRTQALNDLGGRFGSQLKYLLDAMQEGSAGDGTDLTRWQELHSELDASNGALDQMRDTKLDTLTGDIDKMTSALEGLELKFYDVMNGQLRDTVSWVTEQIGLMSDAFEQGGWSEFADTFSDSFATGLTDAAEAVPALIDKIGEMTTSLYDAFSDNENADALGEAATQIVESIGTNLFDVMDSIAESGLSVVDSFVTAFASDEAVTKLGDAAHTMLQNITKGFSEHGEDIISGVSQIIVQMANAVPQLAGDLGNMALVILYELSQGIANNGAAIGEAAGVLLTKLLVGIIDNLPQIVDAGIAIVGGLLMGLAHAAGALVAAAPALFEDVKSSILSINWLETGLKIVKAIWDGVKSLWGDFMDWIVGLSDETPGASGDSMGNRLLAGWSEGINEGEYVAPGGQIVSRDEAIAMGGLIPAAEEVDPATEAYNNALEAANQTADSIDGMAEAQDRWNTALENAPEMDYEAYGITIPETDTDALDTMAAEQESAINQIKANAEASVTDASSKVDETLAQMGADAAARGTEAGEGLTSSLDSSMQGAVTAAQSTSASIVAQFGGLYTQMISVGMRIGDGLVAGMDSMLYQVQSKAAELANAATSAVQAASQVHSPSRITTWVGENIGEGLAVGMESSLDRVASAAGSIGNAAVNRSSILGGMSVRGGSTGGDINFSPTINITGSNLTQVDVRKAVQMSYDEFAKLMRQYQRRTGRVAFG